jgi:hypothetical protein
MFQGGCQPGNCRGNTETKRCNERIAECQPQPQAPARQQPEDHAPEDDAPADDSPDYSGDSADDNGDSADDTGDFGRKLLRSAPYGRRALLQEGNGLCTGVKTSG